MIGKNLRAFRGLGFWLVTVLSAALLDGSEREMAQARQNLDGLRGIQLPKGPKDQERIDALNKKMDAAWSYFESHKGTLPLAEAELKKELLAKEPDQFFLLDVGNLLMVYEGDKAVGLSLSVLERIDPKAEIIQSNWEELFHFVMKLGATGKETDRYFAQADRIYLRNETGVNFFRAPHLVQLNPRDVRCMVYGVAGEIAAKHLGALLEAPGADRKEIISLFHLVGSEAYTPVVKAVMDSTRDYDLISPCIYFLMEVGGPSGRAAVLTIDPSKVDEKTREYLVKMRPEVEKVSYPAMVKILTEMDPKPVNDSKLQQLLDKMEENNGEDNETSPGAVVKSGIPKDRLLAQLKRIRARSFRRETNHVFEDLPLTNMLINALQYK